MSETPGDFGALAKSTSNPGLPLLKRAFLGFASTPRRWGVFIVAAGGILEEESTSLLGWATGALSGGLGHGWASREGTEVGCDACDDV